VYAPIGGIYIPRINNLDGSDPADFARRIGSLTFDEAVATAFRVRVFRNVIDSARDR
jgi:hypothetical protein